MARRAEDVITGDHRGIVRALAQTASMIGTEIGIRLDVESGSPDHVVGIIGGIVDRLADVANPAALMVRLPTERASDLFRLTYA